MMKPSVLKVRRYTPCLIGLNEYLAVYPGAKSSDKICATYENLILLKSMPNKWSNHSYVQRFDYESITFKEAVNISERMEIA